MASSRLQDPRPIVERLNARLREAAEPIRASRTASQQASSDHRTPEAFRAYMESGPSNQARVMAERDRHEAGSSAEVGRPDISMSWRCCREGGQDHLHRRESIKLYDPVHRRPDLLQNSRGRQVFVSRRRVLCRSSGDSSSAPVAFATIKVLAAPIFETVRRLHVSADAFEDDQEGWSRWLCNRRNLVIDVRWTENNPERRIALAQNWSS